MAEPMEKQVADFTDTVVQVIGTGLPGETVRTVIEALAMRFATQVQQEATPLTPPEAFEQVRQQVVPAEQPDSPETTTTIPETTAATDAAPLGTPWGDDAQKPKAALTAQDADPT